MAHLSLRLLPVAPSDHCLLGIWAGSPLTNGPQRYLAPHFHLFVFCSFPSLQRAHPSYSAHYPHYNRAKPTAKPIRTPHTSQWTTSPTSTFLKLRCPSPKFPSLVHSTMGTTTARGLLSTPIDESTRMVLIAPSPKPFHRQISFYDMHGYAYDNVSVCQLYYLEILLMHSFVSILHTHSSPRLRSKHLAIPSHPHRFLTHPLIRWSNDNSLFNLWI